MSLNIGSEAAIGAVGLIGFHANEPFIPLIFIYLVDADVKAPRFQTDPGRLTALSILSIAFCLEE